MTPFQWLFGPLFVASSGACLVRMLRGRMSPRAGAAWSLVWAAAAATVIVPQWSTLVARAFGIGRGADFVLYVAVILGLYVALALYHRHRRLEAVVTELVRRRALESAQHGAEGRAAAPDLPLP